MSFWMYPMKPVRTSTQFFEREDLEDWIMERKLDGHRALISKDNGQTIVYTREKAVIRLPQTMKRAVEELNLPDGVLLDGEIWSLEKRGHWNKQEKAKINLWDVMSVNDRWTGSLSLENRREILLSLVKENEFVQIEHPRTPSLKEFLEIKDEFQSNDKAGIHGVVFKKKKSGRKDHVKNSRESGEWLKLSWRI